VTECDRAVTGPVDRALHILPVTQEVVMQSLLHHELVRVLAADAARTGPRISRQPPRVPRRRRLRRRARTRLAAAKRGA
jgi:hypothetical protein